MQASVYNATVPIMEEGDTSPAASTPEESAGSSSSSADEGSGCEGEADSIGKSARIHLIDKEAKQLRIDFRAMTPAAKASAVKEFVTCVRKYSYLSPLRVGASQSSSLAAGVVLHDYQLVGVDWMRNLYENSVGGILADEMGLGKTLQVLALVCSILDADVSSPPHLVLCPVSVVDHWCHEAAKYAPHLRVLRYVGTGEERRAVQRELDSGLAKRIASSPNLIVTSYEIVVRDQPFLARHFKFGALFVDEGHRLKNPSSQLSLILSQLFAFRCRFILTGTPVQNNLAEMYALLAFAAPSAWPRRMQLPFLSQVSEGGLAGGDVKGDKVSLLREIMQPFLLRRTKAQAAIPLPPLSEVVIFTHLTAMQRRIYKGVLTRDLVSLGEGNASGLSAILTQLRKCCNHPYLFDGTEPEPFVEGDHLWKNSGKLFVLEKLLPRLHAEGHRVLMFSQSTQMLDVVQDYLAYRGMTFERLDGSVRGEERWQAVSRFKAAEDTFVFLLSTRAGGLGLDLVAADIVIMLDSDWNPQADLQAISRSHRQGQKRLVQVFRLITKDSVEEVILRRGLSKLALTASVLGEDSGLVSDEGKDSQSSGQLRKVIEFGLGKLMLPSSGPEEASDAWQDHVDADLILNSARSVADLATATKGTEAGLASVMSSNDLIAKTSRGLYMFEGRDYEDPADADAAALRSLAESARVALGEGRERRRGSGRLQYTGLVDVDIISRSAPRRRVKTAEEKAEAMRKRELRKVHAEQQQMAARLAKWRESGYVSRSLRGRKEDCSEADGSQGVSLSYLVGSAARPEMSASQASVMILHGVNVSGHWPGGGFFGALDTLSPLPKLVYESAGVHEDLSPGDVHLLYVGEELTCGIRMYVALLVASMEGSRKGLDTGTLGECLDKVGLAASRMGCSVHLPRIGSDVDGASWYAVERLLRKHLTSRGVKTTVYYHSRTARLDMCEPHLKLLLPGQAIAKVVNVDLDEWVVKAGAVAGLSAMQVFPQWRENMDFLMGQSAQDLAAALGSIEVAMAVETDQVTRNSHVFFGGFIKHLLQNRGRPG